MAYTPDPLDPTEPTTDRPAVSMAEEFRALKQHIIDKFGTTATQTELSEVVTVQTVITKDEAVYQSVLNHLAANYGTLAATVAASNPVGTLYVNLSQPNTNPANYLGFGVWAIHADFPTPGFWVRMQ